MIDILASQFWVLRLGWTLLHFLWQGTAIVIVYAALRKLLAHSLSAQGRCVLACLSLAAMAVVPPLTFLLLPGGQESHAALWTISSSTSQRLCRAW